MGVKYLTVSITASYDNLELLGSTQIRRLRRLAALLSEMRNLSTFSFIFSDPRSRNPHPRQLPRHVITTILEKLPTSCVNLEIDTNGLDFLVPNKPHFCDMLRRVLPRLQHLRLRLTYMCPAIFATGFNQHGTIGDRSAFTSMVAPSLKTVVINCRTGFWTTGDCGRWPSIDAPVSLLKTLRELAACGCFPAIERLWLVYQPRIQFIGPQYPYYKQCDIIQNQTWAIPFLPGMCPQFAENRDVCLARLPDGGEVLAHEHVVEKFVEGQTWQTTLSGCSVPAAAIQKSDIWCAKPLPLLDLNCFGAVGWCQCGFHLLLRNETVTGFQLMGAVQREGLTDESPVQLVCPAGWRWTEGYLEPVFGP